MRLILLPFLSILVPADHGFQSISPPCQYFTLLLSLPSTLLTPFPHPIYAPIPTLLSPSSTPKISSFPPLPSPLHSHDLFLALSLHSHINLLLLRYPHAQVGAEEHEVLLSEVGREELPRGTRQLVAGRSVEVGGVLSVPVVDLPCSAARRFTNMGIIKTN